MYLGERRDSNVSGESMCASVCVCRMTGLVCLRLGARSLEVELGGDLAGLFCGINRCPDMLGGTGIIEKNKK